jgi:excisionase family DNA binding protein
MTMAANCAIRAPTFGDFKMEIALRVKEFCKRLSIAKSTFYKYKRLGKIHTIRVGTLVLVPMAEVNRIASEGIN